MPPEHLLFSWQGLTRLGSTKENLIRLKRSDGRPQEHQQRVYRNGENPVSRSIPKRPRTAMTGTLKLGKRVLEGPLIGIKGSHSET